MLNRRSILIVVAVLLAVGFTAGIARLFMLRYEAGEVYPPYSTLRADPLGAKAIYAALDELPGVSVQRLFQPLKKLKADEPVTLAVLGIARYASWTERDAEEFESLVFGGGRAVFAFLPYDGPAEESATPRDEKSEREKTEKTEPVDEEKAGKRRDRGVLSFDVVAKRYGFRFANLRAKSGPPFELKALLAQPDEPLERELSWHTGLHFRDLAPEWRTLYQCEGQPVIIERSYGRGSIILLADAFAFSNEALRDERHSALLARVFSGPPRIVFDEEHHGVTDQPGIIQLALKYRLQGVIAALALIAALFVWKSTARFLPRDAASGGTVFVAGRDAAQGFDDLLTRAVPPRELLAVSVAEWRRAFPHHPGFAEVERLVAAEQARPKRARDPVAAYRAIVRLLSHQTRS
jgi:hypothetical protein